MLTEQLLNAALNLEQVLQYLPPLFVHRNFVKFVFFCSKSGDRIIISNLLLVWVGWLLAVDFSF